MSLANLDIPFSCFNCGNVVMGSKDSDQESVRLKQRNVSRPRYETILAVTI